MDKLELEQFDLKDRDIYIYSDIDDIASLDFVKACNNLIIKDNDIIENNKNAIKKLDPSFSLTQTIPDVNIYLNTYGGACYQGFCICDNIKRLNEHAKTNIIVSGPCMSMGIGILLSVPLEQRKCTKNTTFLIHQASGFAVGKSAELEDQAKETKRLTDIIFDIIVENTGITKKELKDNYSKKEDWIITADKALELKLVGEII